MTKFVLHGGFKPGAKQENDSFFREIFSDTKQNLRVLIVYFATDNGEKYFTEDVEQFLKNCGDKKLEFEMATNKEFSDQVKKSDIVYLHGGNSLQLIDAMKEYPEFIKLIKGKVIAADSAGANYLSAIFYSNRNGVCKGAGILPIKLIPHFKEDNTGKLAGIKPELETIRLKEYDFKIFKLDL